MDDIPIDLNKVLSLDLSNLITVINFLHQNSIGLNQKIDTLSNKINTFNELRDDLESFKIKSQAQNQKIDEIQMSFSNFQNSLLTFDNRMNELDQKISSINQNFEQIQTIQNANGDKMNAHEQNLNNLNRVVEEQVKNFEKEQEKSEGVMKKYEERFSDITNDVSKLETKLESNVKNISNLIEISNQKSKDQTDKIHKKVSDLENTVIGLVSKISSSKAKEMQEAKQKEDQKREQEKKEEERKKKEEAEKEKKKEEDKQEEEKKEEVNTVNPNTEAKEGAQQGQTEGTGSQGAPVNGTTIQLPSEEVKSINDKIDNAKKQTDILKIQYAQDIGLINQKLKALQESVTKLTKEDPFSDIDITQITPAGELTTTDIPTQVVQKAPLPKIELPTDSLDKIDGVDNEIFKKMVDSIRIMGQTLEGKAGRDDLAITNRKITKEIDKLTQKLNNSLKLYDAKIASSKTGGNDGSPGLTFDVITETIETQLNQKLQEKSKDLIQSAIDQIDFSNNPKIQEFNDNIANHTEELNKAFESIVDIRKNLLSKDIEVVVESLKGRIDDYEAQCRKLKFDIDEITKQLEGEIDDKKDTKDYNKPKQGSLREHINVIGSRVLSLSSSFEKLEKRVENINRDTLNIVKRDLKAESTRILDEFKGDLKVSISKIEEQLRNKVDRFGLVEFGQRIDNKLTSEMRNKIDRGDLTKNNHYINRKIDSLENKISRTLVDTLIDLQLDEAPLMIKKNMKYVDRCASCNQVLPPNNTYQYKPNISAKITKLPEITS